MKILLNSFYLNGHTLGFYPQTLRNGERAAYNYRVMDARGRLLSTKEA